MFSLYSHGILGVVFTLSMQIGSNHDCCPVFQAESVRDTSATKRSQTSTVGEHGPDIVRTGAAVLTVSDGKLSKFISRVQHRETAYNEKPYISRIKSALSQK